MTPPSLISSQSPARKAGGFTLIELMVVVAIVGILASIAYPSYMAQTRKSRRADAVAAMTKLLQAQEKWRANKTGYATHAQMTTSSPNGLGLTAGSENQYYTMAITSSDTNSYTATATAVSGKSQAGDTGCATMTVTVTNGNPAYSPPICWSR